MSDPGFDLHTSRLRLAPFSQDYLDALCEMDRDPQVMRFITGGVPRERQETRAAIERVAARWQAHGFSWWVVILRETGAVIGSACVQHIENDPSNDIEIGWRLRPSFWGQGFATEAGRAALGFAFERVGANPVVAVANPENRASIAVMTRLGMRLRGVERYYDEDCVVYATQRAAS